MSNSRHEGLFRELVELNQKTGDVLQRVLHGVSESDSNAIAPKSEPETAEQDTLTPRENGCGCPDEQSDETHVYGNSVICETDKKGTAEPDARSPTEIRVDASEGFIPLWPQNTTLRWRFNESSINRYFQDPSGAKRYLRRLFGEAVALWDYASPIRFSENSDTWDFEISMMPADNCRNGGCVLASAFFPNGGRNQLKIYPAMFRQVRREWVETLAHEIGHIYGLRHFFANITETRWRSELFGTDTPFSIMNYGWQSTMTGTDRADLSRLYQLVWSGQLTSINGTPIRLMLPYHASGLFAGQSVAPAATT